MLQHKERLATDMQQVRVCAILLRRWYETRRSSWASTHTRVEWYWHAWTARVSGVASVCTSSDSTSRTPCLRQGHTNSHLLAMHKFRTYPGVQSTVLTAERPRRVAGPGAGTRRDRSQGRVQGSACSRSWTSLVAAGYLYQCYRCSLRWARIQSGSGLWT